MEMTNNILTYRIRMITSFIFLKCLIFLTIYLISFSSYSLDISATSPQNVTGSYSAFVATGQFPSGFPIVRVGLGTMIDDRSYTPSLAEKCAEIASSTAVFSNGYSSSQLLTLGTSYQYAYSENFNLNLPFRLDMQIRSSCTAFFSTNIVISGFLNGNARDTMSTAFPITIPPATICSTTLNSDVVDLGTLHRGQTPYQVNIIRAGNSSGGTVSFVPNNYDREGGLLKNELGATLQYDIKSAAGANYWDGASNWSSGPISQPYNLQLKEIPSSAQAGQYSGILTVKVECP